MGFLSFADVEEAVKEIGRCVEQLGMIGVHLPPSLPVPHPAAPQAFPQIRLPKHLSHPDFDPILAEAERAAHAGASRYCMVLSGRGPTLKRTHELADVIRKVKAAHPIEVCLSVGLLEAEHAKFVADADHSAVLDILLAARLRLGWLAQD